MRKTTMNYILWDLTQFYSNFGIRRWIPSYLKPERKWRPFEWLNHIFLSVKI